MRCKSSNNIHAFIFSTFRNWADCDGDAPPTEGISYLVVLGLVAWSAATKASTGSGLPAGPFGLLGASEGVSYLSLLGGTRPA